jgi:AcrR family transcriptional regulator
MMVIMIDVNSYHPTMSDSVTRSRREEYADTTRVALLDAACELFVAGGYSQVGVDAISRAARVTRGAFYHHFADKPALFEALVIRLQTEALAKVSAVSAKTTNPEARLSTASAAFLDICVEPSYRRLVIEDAPAVLGAVRCREIEDDSVIGAMIAALRAKHEAGRFDAPAPRLAARMIASMLCEAALQLPAAKDPERMRRDALEIVGRVLAAFDPEATRPGRGGGT